MIGKLLVVCILVYCMVGDFVTAVFGFNYIRLVSLLGFMMLLPVYYIKGKDRNILIISAFAFFLILLFHMICGNTNSASFFYTILFGYILFSEKKNTLRYLDYIFVVQFFLVVVEVFLNRHFYLVVYSGIINPTVLDYTDALSLFDETGFRPKGLFPGTLVGCSFTIFYSVLNKDSKKRTLWALIMALLMNGRLAILITSVIAAYHFFKDKRTGKYDLKKFAIISLFASLLVVGLYFTSQGVKDRVDRILSAFVFDESSNNLGRVMIYVAAYNTYINNYDLKSKMFGGEYEILDDYGRSKAAESDVIGMLLEIGVMGSLIYWIALLRLFRNNSNNFVPISFVALLTVFAWIEYRHLTGNVRGSMFWFFYFLCVNSRFFNICKVKSIL